MEDLSRILKELDEIKAYIAYQQEKEAKTYARLLQSQSVVKPVSVDVTIDGITYTCIGEVLYNEYDEICGKRSDPKRSDTKRSGSRRSEEEYILFKDRS